MELTRREFAKILEFYRVSDLGLVFDGFEWVTPDKVLYYWHNPKNGDLYVIELADFVDEFMSGEPCDYIDGSRSDWKVDYWLSHTDTNDYEDLDAWFYWPECGDKCVFAKLKANVSALDGLELERDIPDISEEEMMKRKAKRDSLTVIDSQRRNLK